MRFNELINIEDINGITFGVELETFIPNNSNITVGAWGRPTPINEMDGTVPTFEGSSWKTESDSTIAAPRGYKGCEFVSPVLKGEAGLKHLIEFVNWLKSKGAKVNTSTGCHVHIGIESVIGTMDSSETLDWVVKVGELAKKYSVGIYASTGTLRNMNRWCKPLCDVTKATINEAKADNCKRTGLHKVTNSDRYRMVNFNNIGNRKHTVEFRAFAGTLNTAKLINHVTMSMAIALLAKYNTDARVIWKNYTYTGVAGFRFIWKYATKIIKLTSLKPMNHKCRMWGMAMAAKWDRKMGNEVSEAGEAATRWVRARG